jgi:hypothetical protein
MVFNRLLDGICVCADAAVAVAKKSARIAVVTLNILTPECSRTSD